MVLLISDNNLTSIIDGLNEAYKDVVMNLNFENLVVTSMGREIGKQLITVLVAKQVQSQVSVDVLSESLRERCPSFCSPDDVLLYKGMEYLEKAKATRTESEREPFLVESQRLFSKVAGQIGFDLLKEICNDYKTMNYHESGITLALLYVEKLDTLGYALGYYFSPQNASTVFLFNSRTFVMKFTPKLKTAINWFSI